MKKAVGSTKCTRGDAASGIMPSIKYIFRTQTLVFSIDPARWVDSSDLAF